MAAVRVPLDTIFINVSNYLEVQGSDATPPELLMDLKKLGKKNQAKLIQLACEAGYELIAFGRGGFMSFVLQRFD